MKQIKEKDAIYLEEYDVHVKRYLVNVLKKLIKRLEILI